MIQNLRVFVSLVFLGSLACCLAPAQAQSTTYNYFYVAGQTTYANVAPGGTLSIPIYLQEVNNDASSNSLLANEDGLFGAGVNVSFLSSSGAVATMIKSISANTGSPKTGFDDVLDTASNSASASLQEQVNFSDADGVNAGGLSNGVSMVLLGTVTVQVSSSINQTTKFIVQPYDLQNGNTVTFNLGYDLDDNTDTMNPSGASTLYTDAASTSFSVTTTPEPASACLLLTASTLLAQRRRRRPARKVL